MTIILERQHEAKLKAFSRTSFANFATDFEPQSDPWTAWYAKSTKEIFHQWVGYPYHVFGYQTDEDAIDGFQAQPVLGTTADDYLTFCILRDRWYTERGPSSSTTEIVACPSYLRIIGMGEKAIRYILAQMVSEGDDPDHWFTALEAITGADPVPPSAYGDHYAMAQAWFRWALENYAG